MSNFAADLNDMKSEAKFYMKSAVELRNFIFFNSQLILN